MQRSKGRCEVCGFELWGDVERHHRKRRVLGGDRLSNLMVLHSACHRKVTEHPTWAFRMGFRVAAADDPAAVPVAYRGKDRLMLDDEGNLVTLRSIH